MTTLPLRSSVIVDNNAREVTQEAKVTRYLTLQRLREHKWKRSKERKQKRGRWDEKFKTFCRFRPTAEQPSEWVECRGTTPSMRARRAVRPAAHSQARPSGKTVTCQTNNFSQRLTGWFYEQTPSFRSLWMSCLISIYRSPSRSKWKFSLPPTLAWRWLSVSRLERAERGCRLSLLPASSSTRRDWPKIPPCSTSPQRPGTELHLLDAAKHNGQYNFKNKSISAVLFIYLF